jgi:crotonobetainyl-CoA:carnitine CoA-transferase CaiB-like acyl-CoA transferase
MTTSFREVNMQNKPLAGIRVLEFGGYISAPYATSLLTSLGAEVIKIERPGTGEDFRRGVNNKSPYFIQYNGGKSSLAVNLKTKEGIDLVHKLIPSVDVIVENLRPGKMDALGLGKKDAEKLNPRIIYTSVTGFGNGGPMEQRPAYDMIGQSFGGIVSVLSEAGTKQLTGTCLADLITGISTAAGILAALVGRTNNPGAQHVETSIAEATSALTIDAVTQLFEHPDTEPSRQTRHPQALTFCPKSSDGDNITIHISSSQKFYEAFMDALGLHEIAQEERFVTYPARVKNYFELVPFIENKFAQQTSAHWEETLIALDVPFSRVNTISDLQTDEQFKWLGIYEPARDGVSQVRPPWRFDGERPKREAQAPLVGEHTRALAESVLDAEQVQELIDSGVIYEDATASSVASH